MYKLVLGSVSVLNGMSNFVGYLMPQSFLEKISNTI